MDLDKLVIDKLASRGFTKEQLLNNRGIIGATIDEVKEVLSKNITYEPLLGVVFTITCGNSDIVEICKDKETANNIANEMQEKDNCNSYWVDRRELK
jgi:capsular polysaccharide biosynthesis protein